MFTVSIIVNLSRCDKIASPLYSRESYMILPHTSIDNIVILIVSCRGIIFVTCLTTGRSKTDVFLRSGNTNEIGNGGFTLAAFYGRDNKRERLGNPVSGNLFDLPSTPRNQGKLPVDPQGLWRGLLKKELLHTQ